MKSQQDLNQNNQANQNVKQQPNQQNQKNFGGQVERDQNLNNSTQKPGSQGIGNAQRK